MFFFFFFEEVSIKSDIYCFNRKLQMKTIFMTKNSMMNH